MTKHLMTGSLGKSEYCFPSILDVLQCKGLGETKLSVSLGYCH